MSYALIEALTSLRTQIRVIRSGHPVKPLGGYTRSQLKLLIEFERNGSWNGKGNVPWLAREVDMFLFEEFGHAKIDQLTKVECEEAVRKIWEIRAQKASKGCETPPFRPARACS